MRKRLQIAVAVLLVGLLSGITWGLLREREPVYQGRSLGSWLEGFSLSPTNRFQPIMEQPQWRASEQAVRAIGTNSIPTLLRMLRLRDEPWKLAFLRVAAKGHLLRVHYTSAAELNYRAASSFEALGETASNSVPELLQILQEKRSESSQNAVVFALGGIGPAAASAVPYLLRLTSSTDVALRHNAVGALSRVRSEPQLVVPVMIKLLHDPDVMIRGAAACVLRDFGADAKSAIPDLTEALKDEELYVSSIAREALFAIDPEAAAKAGVKE